MVIDNTGPTPAQLASIIGITNKLIFSLISERLLETPLEK